MVCTINIMNLKSFLKVLVSLLALHSVAQGALLTETDIKTYAKQRVKLTPNEAKPEVIPGGCRAISEQGVLTSQQIQILKQKGFQIFLKSKVSGIQKIGDIEFNRTQSWTDYFMLRPAVFEARYFTTEPDPATQNQYFSAAIGEDLKQIGSCQGVLSFQKNFKDLRQASLYSQGLAIGQTAGSRGEIIIGYEHIQLIRRAEFFDLEKSLKEYRALIKYRKDHAYKPDNEEYAKSLNYFISRVEKLRDKAKSVGLGNDCQNTALMSSYFLKRCGNCNSNTLLILSLLYDLEIPAPEGYEYGLEEYADHVAPVIYNKSKNEIIDLYTLKKSTSGLTSVVSFDHAMKAIQEYVSPFLIGEEKLNSYPDAKILRTPLNNPNQNLYISKFKEMDRLKDYMAFMQSKPHILPRFDVPISTECFVEGCAALPNFSQHSLDDFKAANKDNSKLEKLDQLTYQVDDTCPFYEPLKKQAYSFSGLPESELRMATSGKGMAVVDLFDMIPVESFELNYEPYICDSAAKTTFIRFKKLTDVKILSNIPQTQNMAERQIRRDRFNQLRQRRNGLSGTETIEPLNFYIQDQRVPVLIIPNSECEKHKDELKEIGVKANSMCLFAKNIQQLQLPNWSEQMYPKVKNILSAKDLVSQFKSQKQSWKIVREALLKSHLTLFNKVEADHLVLANLERKGVNFKELFKLAETLRENLKRAPLELTLQLSEFSSQDLELFLSTIFEISWHLNFVSYNFASADALRVTSQHFTNPPSQNELFVGGLLEKYLDWYLTNSEFKIVAEEEHESTPSLRVKFETALNQEKYNVNLPKAYVDSDVCKGKNSGYVQNGFLMVDCSNNKPEENQNGLKPSDPREVIPVSGLLLPYLMAESQRATISARHQLFSLYLWNENNDSNFTDIKYSPVTDVLKDVFGSRDSKFNPNNGLQRIFDLNSSYSIDQLLADPVAHQIEDCYKATNSNLEQCKHTDIFEMSELAKFKINLRSAKSKWSLDSLTSYVLSEVSQKYQSRIANIQNANLIEDEEAYELIGSWQNQGYFAFDKRKYREMLARRNSGLGIFNRFNNYMDVSLEPQVKGSEIKKYDFLAKTPDRGGLNKPTYFFGKRLSVEKVSNNRVDYYQTSVDLDRSKKMTNKSGIGLIHIVR